jgi:hypothetical protein
VTRKYYSAPSFLHPYYRERAATIVRLFTQENYTLEDLSKRFDLGQKHISEIIKAYYAYLEKQTIQAENKKDPCHPAP